MGDDDFDAVVEIAFKLGIVDCLLDPCDEEGDGNLYDTIYVDLQR